MKAAIYVRVSTDQQAEKGYSIATQLEACRKYARELGASLIEEFVDDGYSGEYIDRPALTALRAKLKAKLYNLVIAYAPDRLARKTIHLLIISEEISKAGAMRKFASVNFESTSEGELMYKFQGIVAEYEKEKIKERTLRGKRGKAAQGLVISNTQPFGYTFDAAKSMYVINEVEAEIVRMIFDLLLTQKMGTALIAKALNARGIASPRAKTGWRSSSIHRILTNSLYKGVIHSMKYKYEKVGLTKRKRTLRPQAEWIPIPVPAIIAEATWLAAQQQLQKNKAAAKRNLKQAYLLNGLVTCAKCGKAMTISHSGSKNFVSYYACLSKKSAACRHSGQQPCTARQIPTALLDDYVFAYVWERWQDWDHLEEYALAAPSLATVQQQQTTLEQITATEQALLQQKAALLRWFQQKILLESEVEHQLNAIQQQLADIRQIKTSLAAELTASAASSTAEFTVILNNLQPADFSIEEKKTALRAVVEQVIVERLDSTRGRGSRPAITIELKLK